MWGGNPCREPQPHRGEPNLAGPRGAPERTGDEGGPESSRSHLVRASAVLVLAAPIVTRGL